MQRAERLLNLMMYLLAARAPVTAADVRYEVEGYGDCASDDAFLRMFERDKDDLREAGVPIVSEPGHEGEAAYRVDRDAYLLPPLPLTPAEIAALNLAAGALTEDPGFPMREDLRHAVLKLTAQTGAPAALAAATGDGSLAGSVADDGVRREADLVGAVIGAIRRRKRVAFTYRSMSSGATERREVEPYGLFYSAGAWYVVGRDAGRDGIRTFRVSRIEGKLDVNARAPHTHDYEVPPDFDVRHQADRPWEMGPTDTQARVRFAPRVAWMAEREVAGSGTFTYASDGAGLWDVAADEEALVRWLLGFGARAELLEPTEARARIRAMVNAALERAPAEEIP